MVKNDQSEIVQSGSPVLNAHAKIVPLKDIGSPEIKKILGAMQNALDKEPDGVAIAAPQIGVSLRIFIVSRRAFLVDAESKSGKEAKDIVKNAANMVVINPEITRLSRKRVEVPEGCLSVRWYYGNTLRHEKATIRALDENGKPFTYGGSGLIAQIFQHETDHLNGILFIDHATQIEKLSTEEVAEVEKRAREMTKEKK